MVIIFDIHGPLLTEAVPESWRNVIEKTTFFQKNLPSTHWFAGLTGDGVVAGVGGIIKDWGGPGIGWLGPTFVLPEFRGNLLQYWLILKRINYARQLGLTKVHTAVDVNNTASLRNVLNTGFRVERYSDEEKHLELLWRPQ